jgi:DNA-binding GntR family transcriptional regulator
MKSEFSIESQTRLVDEVVNRLRRAILDGFVKPGEALSVPDLSRRFNISRSPIREAVLHLVGEGLAIESPRRGVSVATIGTKDLAEIYQCRLFLEGGAARLAAHTLNASQLAILSDILREQEEIVAIRDEDWFHRINGEFHAVISEASGNGKLTGLLARLDNQTRLAMLNRAHPPLNMREALKEHRAIVFALSARDPDAAEAAMRAHITRIMTRMMGAPS